LKARVMSTSLKVQAALPKAIPNYIVARPNRASLPVPALLARYCREVQATSATAHFPGAMRNSGKFPAAIFECRPRQLELGGERSGAKLGRLS
jgi:hypothetical protein